MYDEFTSRDTVVIAVAQEDTDIASHAKFLRHFKQKPSFGICADLNQSTVGHYDRTTAYLIDKEGVVRQVFPMMVHHRASWYAVLHEIDRVFGTK